MTKTQLWFLVTPTILISILLAQYFTRPSDEPQELVCWVSLEDSDDFVEKAVVRLWRDDDNYHSENYQNNNGFSLSDFLYWEKNRSAFVRKVPVGTRGVLCLQYIGYQPAVERVDLTKEKNYHIFLRKAHVSY